MTFSSPTTKKQNTFATHVNLVVRNYLGFERSANAGNFGTFCCFSRGTTTCLCGWSDNKSLYRTNIFGCKYLLLLRLGVVCEWIIFHMCGNKVKNFIFPRIYGCLLLIWSSCQTRFLYGEGTSICVLLSKSPKQ